MVAGPFILPFVCFNKETVPYFGTTLAMLLLSCTISPDEAAVHHRRPVVSTRKQTPKTNQQASAVSSLQLLPWVSGAVPSLQQSKKLVFDAHHGFIIVFCADNAPGFRKEGPQQRETGVVRCVAARVGYRHAVPPFSAAVSPAFHSLSWVERKRECLLHESLAHAASGPPLRTAAACCCRRKAVLLAVCRFIQQPRVHVFEGVPSPLGCVFFYDFFGE